MKAYLAGPDVFLADAIAVGEAKVARCREHGIEGLYPLDQSLDGVTEAGLARAIFRGNVAMMRAADVILADLTPFRSPSADPGTAFELGFAFALGKPVFGYSASPEPLFERVAGAPRETLAALPDGRLLHPDGVTIEDFGLADNLMLIEAIEASDGVFVAGGPDPFGACLAEVARRFGRQADVPSTSRRLAG